MTEYKLFAHRVGLMGIVNIIASLRGLILLPILTKTLGAELYGIWTQILVTLNLLAPFAVLQLDTAFVRFIAGEKDEAKIRGDFYSVFSTVSLFGVFLSALIFILSKPVAVAFFGGENSVFFVQLLSFMIFLTALDTICIRFFEAFLQIKKYSGFLILQEILEMLLVSYALLSGYGLFGALLSLIASKSLLLFLAFFLIHSQIGLGYPNLFWLKHYLKFSLPLVPSTLFGWVVTISDRYVIAYLIDVSSVGIYSAAYNIGGIVAFFMGPIGIILFPTISNLYENHKMDELKTHLKYSLKYSLMFEIPSLFGLAILSKSLLAILTTSEFLTAYLIVPIIALGTIFYSSSGIFSLILMLFKRTKALGLISMLGALINIVLNFILIPVIGILGAAVSTLITFLFIAVACAVLSFEEFSFDIDLKSISKSIIASIPMTFVIWKFNPHGAVNVLIAIGIAATIYFSILILLKGFTKEEYKFLKVFLNFNP